MRCYPLVSAIISSMSAVGLTAIPVTAAAPPPVQGRPTHAQKNPVEPVSEPDFCSVVNNASAAYAALYEQWNTAGKEGNKVRQSQIADRMTQRQRLRDVQVFELVRSHAFAFDQWQASVINVNSPQQDWVKVDVHLNCSPITLIHAWIHATPRILQFLGELKRNDHLLMTGKITHAWGGPITSTPSPGPPGSANDLEGSLTESGSMKEPEYTVALTTIDR